MKSDVFILNIKWIKIIWIVCGAGQILSEDKSLTLFENLLNRVIFMQNYTQI